MWPAPRLVSAHAHLLLVGGVLPVILGTAVWLFPRPRPGDPRVRAWHGEAAWWGLALGTALRAAGEMAVATTAGRQAGPVAVLGGLLQVAGIGCGVLALRPRIRAGADRRV